MTLGSLAFAVSVSLAVVDSIAENPKSDLSIISDYVISHKHWSPKIFRIERQECDCSYALYDIIYLPELKKKNAVPGGGKSFEIYYDEHRHKVVKELYFQ